VTRTGSSREAAVGRRRVLACNLTVAARRVTVSVSTAPARRPRLTITVAVEVIPRLRAAYEVRLGSESADSELPPVSSSRQAPCPTRAGSRLGASLPPQADPGSASRLRGSAAWPPLRGLAAKYRRPRRPGFGPGRRAGGARTSATIS
jgi:hypothetical protein